MTKRSEPASPTPLRDGELARRDGDRVSVRSTPLRVRVELPDLMTADGHRLNANFACAVTARPERAERQMLEEAFLSERGTASAADVAALFASRLRDVAGRAATGRGVTEWLAEGAREELVDVLRKAADAAGFASGLEVLPPYHLDLESPSLQRMERDRAARELVERDQGERLSHLRRAAEVVKEFEAIREASPGVSVSALVARMAAGDQASVVRTLVETGAGGRGLESLYVVAGSALVRISEGETVEEIAAPAEAGPFRSVQGVEVDGERRIAIGGKSGVIVLDPGGHSVADVYATKDVTSTMGFNRVVAWGGRIWASHSEAGLVAWDVGRFESPSVRIGIDRIGGAPRHLTDAGDRLLFAAGANICSLDPSLEIRPGPDAGSSEPVVGLFATARGVIVVRASGEIETLDPATLQVSQRDRRASRITAAAPLPFYDSQRILLAGEDGPLTCLSADDPVVLQYPTPHRGLRALAASAGRVAGISADRQRVILIDVGGASAGLPSREVHLGGRLKHRVADVTFVR